MTANDDAEAQVAIPFSTEPNALPFCLHSALWLLRLYGHSIPARLPHEEVVGFFVEVAEENTPPERTPRTVVEIAAWFHDLISESSTG